MRILFGLLLLGLASEACAEFGKWEKRVCQLTHIDENNPEVSEAAIGSIVNLYYDDGTLFSLYLEFNTNEYGSMGYYALCEAECVGEVGHYKHLLSIKPSPYEPKELRVSTAEGQLMFLDYTDIFKVTKCVSQKF